LVVGSVPELGEWQADKGLPCTTTAASFPVWASPAVEIGQSDVEFKVVVAKANADKARWEGGDNKKLTAPGGTIAGTRLVLCEFGKPSAQISEAAGIQDLPAALAAKPDGTAIDSKAAAPAGVEPRFQPPPLSSEPLGSVESACLKLRLSKGLDQPDAVVAVCGETASLGAWSPTSARAMQNVDGLWILPSVPAGVVPGKLFKYVVYTQGKEPRWESIENRRWPGTSAPVVVHIFDRHGAERPKRPPGQGKKLGAGAGSIDEFVAHIAEENRSRTSYRLKLELPKLLLEEDQLGSLSELACLQAYLTFVASGQIACKEDGGHHRPCAAAKAAQIVTEALWDLARNGDAERFIARRIFPSLPSFSDEFTTAVPMTRIRDIAHRNDIPKDMKLYIKHQLQNKLHRCADPGDLVKMDQLVERIDREGGYSEGFVKEMHIFQVELRDFFNAAGLDASARQLTSQEVALRPLVDKLLWDKGRGADAFEQLEALAALRREVAPRAEEEQSWLRLDVELDKYAFVLLSQVAGGLDAGGKGSPDWWTRLLRALVLALAQTELTGLSPEECAVIAHEVEAVAAEVPDRSKAPFAPQRLAASMDRVMRICFGLQMKLEEAYAGVPALGKALCIDAHAVSVFVEAELRASVLFQVSKLSQMALQQAKQLAGLPLWTAISAGAACGCCVSVAALSESWSRQLPAEGAVLFCEEASGDEEIPSPVQGVVVGRDLPVLSHLALRARQLGVVFACTAEAALFAELRARAKDGAPVKLLVDASGSTRVEQSSQEELHAAAAKRAGAASQVASKKAIAPPKLGALSLDGDKVLDAVEIADKPQIAGGKAASCGKLEKLAKAAGFVAPKGIGIPFGMMKKAVKGEKFDAALRGLKAALDASSADVEASARVVREAVEQCEVPQSVIEGIMAKLPQAERVAVRSSANSEDLENVSGAGLHDSVLGVDARDPGALKKAVLQVWGSMFTLRAVQSRHAAGMPLYDGIAMGVLVQPMASRAASAAYAFIAFSKDVVADDAGSVYIEICIGLGETLASANEPGTPYRLVVQKKPPHAVSVRSLASFSYGLHDAPGGPKHLRVDYSKERPSTDRAFLEKLGQDVAAVADRVEKDYGVPMDMEGIVLEDNGRREVHLVQARPIVEG